MNIVVCDVPVSTNKDGLFCINHLHTAAGGHEKDQPALWLRLDKTKELIEEISNSTESQNKIISSKAGRYGGTYVCKELVYAYAMWISPKFHLRVIRTFDDFITSELQRKVIRELARDGYKDVTKALKESLEAAGITPMFYHYANEADMLNLIVLGMKAAQFREAHNLSENAPIRECSDQGFKFIHKVDGNNSLCECLSCGHVDTYDQGAMRDGRVACSNCSPGHWNEPSWFYMIKISPNDQRPFVKVGISNKPSQRYTQYGLPEGTLVEELTKVLFQTKLEAVGYESAVMQFLDPYHIDPEEAKMILSKSGWTECFTIDSLNHLIDERGFHQLSLVVE